MNDPANKGKLKRVMHTIHVELRVEADDVQNTDPEKIQQFIHQLSKMIGLRAESQALIMLKALVESDDDTYLPQI